MREGRRDALGEEGGRMREEGVDGWGRRGARGSTEALEGQRGAPVDLDSERLS